MGCTVVEPVSSLCSLMGLPERNEKTEVPWSFYRHRGYPDLTDTRLSLWLPQGHSGPPFRAMGQSLSLYTDCEISLLLPD